MSNTAAEPITLEAFDPAELLIDANMRTGAEATVTKADVALCKTIAAARPDACGNNVPITIVRRPGGQLRVRTGHRRTIGCNRAVLAACLSAHSTMINGNALCAALAATERS